MKNLYLSLFFSLFSASIFAQKDSIQIQTKLSEDHKTLTVSQKMVYFNKSAEKLDQIKLLNWTAAYQKDGTSLSYRKLENRDRDLHFAEENQLGKLLNLQITTSQIINKSANYLSDENIFITLNKSLLPQESVTIHLEYQIQLPDIQFTGYGTSGSKVALKYFFLVPDSFDLKNYARSEFNDVEETSNYNTFWNVNIDLPEGENSTSNLLEQAPNSYAGTLNSDPEIFVTKETLPKISTFMDEEKVEITFGYSIDAETLQKLEFYIPLHLKFIKEKIGSLPDKIYLSEKFKNKEDFLGNETIKIWKYHFPLFSDIEQIDLDYFSIVSQKVMEQSFVTNKNTDHWLTNGLQTYLEIQYLRKFYAESKLLGLLPEAKFLGIKPLKLFHAADLKLTERYGIAYQYMMTQNLDQKINAPFLKLSNFNEMAISNFETGNLFNFVSEKMGGNEFNLFLKNYLSGKEGNLLQSDDFLQELGIASEQSSDFLISYISKKQRINFSLKSFKRKEGKLQVRIKKNSALPVPFKIQSYSKSGETKEFWFDTESKKTDQLYEIPDAEAYKIVINSGHSFPEPTFRDNYLYTTGLFSNMKKIKFKLVKDVPNPEYNEIYLNPRVKFNVYDKVLLGLNFQNQSLFDQNFEYSLTPYFSTGTGQLTGSGGLLYKIMPPDSFFQTLDLGVSGSYFHYDFDLTYQKYTAYANMELSKEPRSAIRRNFVVSYSHFEKQLSPALIAINDYDRYNVLNIGFGYSDNKLIHEKYFGLNYQMMEDFNKISGEAYYRWEFAENKKLSVRLFAGYFLNNNTRNDNFNLGISRVSDYSFSYNLLGQSATSGILSQQYIQAEGGFKSYVGNTVNQWITTLNADTHVWKIFNIYADAGMYSNKGEHSKFIYDSGVKLRIIPDFLEVYLPVYSSLGFEPSFKDYASRIRFSLVLNFSSLVNTLRRGWY